MDKETIDLTTYKPIPNYSRYLVSESGEVWDTVQEKILTPNINGGYKCLNLHKDDGRKLLDKVHRLVAYTYLTKPENAVNYVVHIDTDRMNNHYTNLRWKIKGEVDDSALTYSTLGGVRYSLRELDTLVKQTGLPVWTVRNRLEDKWTLEEMLQGYKHSSVFWIDDMKFIGELEAKKYLDMLDRDAYRKERELLKCEIRHRRFTEELERLQREKELQEKIEKRGTENSVLVKQAYTTWKGIMSRCYDPTRLPDYLRYGAKGVTVCDEWKDVDVFIGWYVEHHIEGWDIEKDIIPLYEGRTSKQYSPDNCCFVPKAMNQWFALTSSTPKLEMNSVGHYIAIRNRINKFTKPNFRLTSNNEQELLEQWHLYKDLHFEKRVWRMREDHKRLCSKYPTTPQISPKLLSILENFSTEEYLRKKHLERKNSLIE